MQMLLSQNLSVGRKDIFGLSKMSHFQRRKIELNAL